MKKTAWIAVIAAGLVLLGTGSVFAAGQIAKSSALDEETARKFAFLDADVAAEDAQVTESEFKFEKGRFVYQIEFIAEGYEYDYTLDAKTGSVLEKECEALTWKNASSETGADPDPVRPAEPSAETADAVRPTVETAAERDQTKPAEDNTAKVDPAKPAEENTAKTDPAKPAEENTAKAGQTKTAENVKNKPEKNVPSVPETTQAAPEMISSEAAKDIALSRAGRAASEAVFTKIKLETSDGRLVYDIEFYVQGQMFYEYELDAYTGAVLEEDRDTWQEEVYDLDDDDYDDDDYDD